MTVLFKNDPKLKEELIARAIAHRKADRITHEGEYFDLFPEDSLNPISGKPNGWRGCAIGCLSMPADGRFRPREQASSASALLRTFGIPRLLTLLAEAVFESSDEHDTRSLRWPERFAKALPVGVELSDSDVRAFVDRDSNEFHEHYDDDFSFDMDQAKAATQLTRWLRSLDKKEAA